MNREEQAQKNREAAPNVAEMLDDLRAQGLTFRVLAVEDFETGFKAGEFEGENDDD